MGQYDTRCHPISVALLLFLRNFFLWRQDSSAAEAQQVASSGSHFDVSQKHIYESHWVNISFFYLKSYGVGARFVPGKANPAI
jgi:hypothetical protein